MKKLLMGITLMASLSAFAGVRVICGDEMRNAKDASKSLNQELQKAEYSEAITKNGAVEFPTRKVRIQQQGQGGNPPPLVELTTACVVLENV